MSGDAGVDGRLRFVTAQLRPEQVDAARTHAYRVGRVLERDGLALLSRGAAARLELPLGVADPDAPAAVLDALASITRLPGHDATDTLSPLALGSCAFDPDGFSELVVPIVTVVVEHATATAIAVGTAADLAVVLAGFPFAGMTPVADDEGPAGDAPDSFTLASARPHADFRGRVRRAVASVRAGELDKVVLVREVEITANRPVRQEHLLERLRALHPSCCAFAIDGLVGASPELLIRRTGTAITSQPLAGTVARSGDPEEDLRLAAALLASEKDRAEHRFVVDAIVSALTPLCTTIDAPATPHLLELRNVAHLATKVTGVLADRDDVPPPDALTLVGVLHPTPAVGGWPRAEALDYLRKYEEVERGRFAGPVGYISATGDGEWWIGIRSALIDGERTRLFAGVGIVADSDPAAELAETQLKLQALLAAAVRP